MANLPYAKNWMQYVGDNKKLSELTIPGTHDTGSWPLSGLYQCQSMSLKEQLNAGIRFLDIRLKPSGKNDELEVWHGGDGKTGLNFKTDIVGECQTFLNGNPSETIVMSVNDESKTYHRKEVFFTKLWEAITLNNRLFYTSDKMPELHEVRSGIVFFRRCWAPLSPFPVGINMHDNWPDNKATSWEDALLGMRVWVQDKYNGILSVNMKEKFEKHVKPYLEEARKGENGLFINFTSGTIDGGGVVGQTPRKLAEKTNDLLVNYLAQNAQARYGIIPMDFPENQPALIKSLIDGNYTDPLLLPVFQARTGNKVFLNFDGNLHSLLQPEKAGIIFGHRWDRKALPALDYSVNGPGSMLVQPFIVKIVPGVTLHLAYFGKNGKNVIRHIPNEEILNSYGLFGTPQEVASNFINQFEIGAPLTFGGNRFLQNFRVRNMVDGKLYLIFDGLLHHIPDAAIANRILGNSWGHFLNWSFPDDRSTIGPPLTDGRIRKFSNSYKLYLSYTVGSGDRSRTILRHIPNVAVKARYGLFGKAETADGSEEIGSPLTHYAHLGGAPKNNDIIEIYTILGFDKCLDVYYGKNQDGAEAAINVSNNGNNQRWKLIDAGEGFYYLEPQHAAGKVLDVDGNKTDNGTRIIIHGKNQGDNQKWKFISVNNAPGLFVLTPKSAPASCLDVKQKQTANGTPVILYSKKDEPDNNNQLWCFHKVD